MVDVLPAEEGEEDVRAQRHHPGHQSESRPLVQCPDDQAKEESAHRP